MNSRRSLLTAALGFALLDTRGKPVPAWRLTIYDGPNDDLTKRADEAISQLERVCRPFLK